MAQDSSPAASFFLIYYIWKMFNTKQLVFTEKDVPSNWVFEYYLDLPEKLTGQDVKIKSIFNPNERTPSMCIFVDQINAQYKYKDFSSGKFGSKIDLVKELFHVGYPGAVEKIIEDFNSFIKNNEFLNSNFKAQEKYKVDYVKPREWTEEDKNFWLRFRIGATILNTYNVKPLEYYNMVKKGEDGSTDLIKIKGSKLYRYFKQDGSIYKIYQPAQKKHKFIKVCMHTQGLDQLTYTQPYLVITSGLKDVMSLAGIGYNVELIAPDSENTMLKPILIENLKNKYKKIITLFDNDTAGKKAVDRYKEVYNINGFVCPLENDPADALHLHGLDLLHKKLKPLLKQTLSL